MKTAKEVFVPRLEEALDEPLEEPTHAGVAVMAHDTRRVLMIQRSLDQDDPPEVQGTWEFPSGGRECRLCRAPFPVEGSAADQTASGASVEHGGLRSVEMSGVTPVLPSVPSRGTDSEQDVLATGRGSQVTEAEAGAVRAGSDAIDRVAGVVRDQGSDVAVRSDVEPAVEVADLAFDGGSRVAGRAGGAVVQEAVSGGVDAGGDAVGQQGEGGQVIHAATVPPEPSQDHEHEWETPEEAAWREFSEETGLPRPDGETVDGWRSADGVYQGFLYLVEVERDAFDELNPDGEAADTDNPDDPGRRNPDISAWFTVEQMQDMGSAIRPEVRKMDWSVFDLEDDMAETETEEPQEEVEMRGDVDPIPFYALIAPEGAWSGDGRRFLENSMRSRPVPMPLTWQKFSTDGHGNAATVAKFDRVWRYGGNVWGSGFVLANSEANEWTALVAEFGRFGVSVDADDLDQFSVEFDEEGRATFSDARMCSACTVSIPAFAEAFVALGEWSPEIADSLPEPSQEIPTIENDASLVASIAFKDYSTEQRRKMAQDGSAIPIKNDDGEIVDGSYPIADCEDLKNAIQAIGRAADPAEVKSHIRSRKETLGCPDVDLPDTWALEAIFGSTAEEFVDVAPGITEDGPGWLTHPVDTDRLRDYWVRGPGAAKIGWGTPGDFNRCRVNLAEYVKPQHLSGYCANRHFDALGYWPGQGPHAKGETIEMSKNGSTGTSMNITFNGDPQKGVESIAEESEQGSLTAAAPRADLPYAWFTDPVLSGPTALTVTEEGRVFGHLATWGVCHIGFDGDCIEPPHSLASYAYFRTGQVQTDDGPVAVGNISMGGGHAAPSLGYRPAMAHYDETSSVVADVAVGEDQFGIWFSGAIRSGVSEGDVAELQASGGLSGDWRLIGGNLELVAALAVNVGGFPVPRIQVAASAGQTTSLVAAGVITEQDDEAQFAERVAARVKEILETERAHAALRAQIVDEDLADLRAKVEG